MFSLSLYSCFSPLRFGVGKHFIQCQKVSILDFGDQTVSVMTSQLCHCSTETDVNNMYVNAAVFQ